MFVIPAVGGTARQLTFHSGNDEVVGWSPDSKQVVFRAMRGDGVFPSMATLYQVPVEGGRETNLPTDWGWWGSYSTDGKRFAFNRHPSVWTRKHYRGSFAADIWIADLAAKTATPVLPEANYNRFWPMFARGAWQAGSTSLAIRCPDEKNVKPGNPEGDAQPEQHLQDLAKSDAQPVQLTKRTGGNVYYPSLSSDGKVIVYEADFSIWKLDVASGKSSEVKIDIITEDKKNEVEPITIENEADGFDISPSGKRAVISARNQIFTIATDRGDITTIANNLGASRDESPAWSPDGKHIAFISIAPAAKRFCHGRPQRKELEANIRPGYGKEFHRLVARLEVADIRLVGQEALSVQCGGWQIPRASVKHLGLAPRSGVFSRQQMGQFL